MAQLQPVLLCLQQTQSPDPQGIKQAEQQLKALAQQAGYGCVLAQIALASPQEVSAHIRQLAAVLLKQYVKQHWIAGERGFEPPGSARLKILLIIHHKPQRPARWGSRAVEFVQITVQLCVFAETSREDKAQIRNALPAGLRDPDSKIRTAIAMAIAAIANWDWPQDWPGLLENIVGSIKKRDDPQLGEQHEWDRPQQHLYASLSPSTHLVQL